MVLSNEKMTKLKEMDTDFSRLILKFQQYLSEKYMLTEEAKEKIIPKRKNR